MKTSYSRHELYALGEPLGDGATRKEVGRVIYGGGGGGQPTHTESKVTNSNIPEYAQPYVENMLSAAQKQIYEADGTTFKPYKAYGGTYDAAGRQTSYDPSKGIAGFQPMQLAAQRGVAGMQLPDQYRQAMDVTGAGIGGGFNVAGQSNVGGFQNQVGGYMSPYMQNVTDIQKREAARQSGMQGVQQQSQAASAGAFGGSRDAIMRAERERNLSQQMGDIQAQGSQAAFQSAQQQYNQNLQNQLAGYGQAMQGANQLASLGGQQLQAQQGIYGLQNQYGAQQQALEQSKLNQAMQDYANAQQYPMMQLGSLSNMLRGLPMQATSTQQYQAQPNMLTQGIGAAGSMASLYNAYNNPNASKPMAAGGITSIPRYDVGGQVMSQLQQMDDEALAKEAKESPSQEIRRMATEILKTRQAGMDSAPQMAAAPQMDMAPQPQQDMGMAGGGIIAFDEGGTTSRFSEFFKDSPEAIKRREMFVNLKEKNEAMMQAERNRPGLFEQTTPERISSTEDKAIKAGQEYLGASRVIPDPRSIKAAAPVATPKTDLTPAAAPKTDLAPAAAPKAGPAPASSDEPIYTGTERPPEFLQAMEEQAAAGNLNSADLLRAYYKKFPKAVAPPADPSSILAATPTADKAAITAAQVDPFTEARAALAKANTEAGKSKKELYDEDLEAKKALGLDKNEAQQEYMKNTMAQKANIAADAEQKKYLRLAEFFASWGSTPGDTLVAGMKAVKEKIPDMIADIKEQRKAEAEADKVLYELGQAQRQEKLGNWDKVELRKTKAAEIAAKLQGDLTTAQANFEGQKLTSQRMVDVAGINKAGSIKVAEIGERSHNYTAELAADSQNYATRVREAGDAIAKSGQKDTKDITLFNHQTDQLRDLSGKLSAVLNTGTAQKLQEKILRAELVPDNAQLQAEAKAAGEQLKVITKPIEDQIKLQKANVDAAGKRAFGADWTNVSASANSNKTDPLGLR